MSKVLKTLEMRKLIKAVKSVASKNRKVYMLYELEPSKELTGGAWYTEQEFDAEFIQVLRDHCLKFVMHKGRVTLEELCDFVSCTGTTLLTLPARVVAERFSSGARLSRAPLSSLAQGWPTANKTFGQTAHERTVMSPPGGSGRLRHRGALIGPHVDAIEETSLDHDEDVFYVPATLEIPSRGSLTSVPCGVCPVNDCPSPSPPNPTGTNPTQPELTQPNRN
eukprot:1195854-Prorocentrum_minimum.AAC.7